MRHRKAVWLAVGGGVLAGGVALYLVTRKPKSGIAGTSGIIARLINGQSVASSTVSNVAPVSPAYGSTVSVAVAIQNVGQLSGNYSVSAYTVLSGSGPSGTVEGHLGQSGSPTTPVTGSLAANGTTTVQLVSGSIDYAQSIANYNPSTGLDLYIVVTDTTTGASNTYLVPSAIFPPSESPSSMTVTSVTLSTG